MPTFDTPDPLTVTLEFPLGTARIVASDRTDTVVDVLPQDGAREADVQAAQQTKVTCSGGALLVKGPKQRSPFAKPGGVDITIEVPSGSGLQGSSPMADLTGEGRLGECEFKTGLGGIRLGEASRVRLRSGLGEVVLDRVEGEAEITAAGRIEIGTLGGDATIKNGNGDTIVGEAFGDVRLKSSNGRVSVGVAHASVEAKSACGDIRVGDVARGLVTLRTATGNLEIGIRESTAAWLDVNTGLGSVRNSLGTAEGPQSTDETVEVRARTGAGNIVIRRA